MVYIRNLFLSEFKEAMQSEFQMTNIGLMKYYMGIEVDQFEKGIFICEQKYAIDILKRFKMNKCNPTNTPIEIGTKLINKDEGTSIDYTLYKRFAGSLMYLATTRPNIMYVVSLISRFMENPKISHWKVGKRILRYIAGTTD